MGWGGRLLKSKVKIGKMDKTGRAETDRNRKGDGSRGREDETERRGGRNRDIRVEVE